MVDGNAIAAGHIAGGIGVILLSDGLAKGAFKGAGEVKACYVAGTLVLLADGSAKPIDQIKAGDKVLTRSQASDERAATYGGIVADVYHLHHNGTLRLSFATGGSVEATPSHPFFVMSKGFTAAENLQIGDRIAETDTEKADAVTKSTILMLARTTPTSFGRLTVPGCGSTISVDFQRKRSFPTMTECPLSIIIVATTMGRLMRI